MKPRTLWYANVLGFSSVGTFFLGVGIYGLIVGSGGSSHLFVLGAVSVVVGLRIWWEAVQLIRPVKTTPQNITSVCPFCGAIVPKDATFCAKCGREINE